MKSLGGMNYLVPTTIGPRGIRIGTAFLLAALAGQPQSGGAQPEYGHRLGERGPTGVVFRPYGPGVDTDLLDPMLRKQYLPQEIRHEHRWRTWQTTNYAVDSYWRYLSPLQQGEYHYDSFGNFLTRGWLIYDWTEDRPRTSEGSRILRTSNYSGFFSNLIIAADQKGQYSYAVTIGDEIRTTLTPMTFRKAVYNGTKVDFSSDRLSITGLMSRISAPGFTTDPNPAALNNAVNMQAGRAVFSVGEYVTLGGTFVNAHSTRGTLESFKGNPLKGALSTSQVQNQVNTITIRLSDDSPGDSRGGAVLLFDDVEVSTTIGEVDTVLYGNSIGFTPDREGGTLREGVLVADGSEQILLRYELSRLGEIISDRDLVKNIRGVRFRLILVNDYKVEVTSDRQTNLEGQPVFLTVAQAEGNIQDGSNRREVAFNYGLPTANQIFGFTLETREIFGFRLFTEFDVNHKYRQYPNNQLQKHRAFSGIEGDETAQAWMMNLSKSDYPWYFLAEGFYMDEDYSTSSYILDGIGRVDYEDDTRSLYDFVDDNDDDDRLPDQKRLFQDPRQGHERQNQSRSSAGFADDAIFPGWDENGDFVSDFNQNSNRLQENVFPDYDEPFLRYASDRPEFLFGIDLNNNGWIDRFENDNEPDYPYKRDHMGYNLFLRRYLSPELRLQAGQTRQELISDERRNRTTYGMVAYERDIAGVGKFRFYNLLKKAEDDIQDDLVQWVQAPGSTGSLTPIADPLAALDTWINTAWLGLERRANLGVNYAHKLKYQTLGQGSPDSGHKENTRFLGIVNKAAYLIEAGSMQIRPRLKSELLRDNTPYALGGEERQEWTGTLDFSVRFPFLNKSHVELGVEQLFFEELIVADEEVEQGEFTGDFRNTVLAAQVTNIGEYAGYRLITQFGYSLNRRSFERFDGDRQTETGGLSFATVYASLR